MDRVFTVLPPSPPTLPYPHLTRLLVGRASTSTATTAMADLPSPLLFLLRLLLLPIPLAASSTDLTALLVLKAAVTRDLAGALTAWPGASTTNHCH
jgi:hypothetical protein